MRHPRRLDAAGAAAGIWFERNVGVTMPPTTGVTRAPRIAYLVSTLPPRSPGQSQTTSALDSIFGYDATGNQQTISRLVTSRDWGYVDTQTRPALRPQQPAHPDPLLNYDVIYTTLTTWPATSASIGTGATIASAGNGGASESGNTVTITTSSANTVAVGNVVTITGVGVAGYNGTWTVTGVTSSTKFTYTNPTSGLGNSGGGSVVYPGNNGAAEAGNTVTITTTAATGLSNGDSVTISGVGVAGYNGTYTITAIVSATQFQYTNPTSGLAASGGGTVSTINSLARQRLNAFFARGGGFFSTNVSSGAFLTGATPSPLLTGTLTQSNTSAYGGIVRMDNPGTVNSPVSGPEPSQDYYLIPSNMTYYSAIPTGAVVDEQYPANISTIGAANGFLAGLWGTTATPRSTAVNGKPILIHGATATGSRYMFMATDPTNKIDEQREWLYLVQDALWSNLTDEPTPSVSVTAPTGSASYNAGDALPVAWNTNGLVTKGQFSIWVVSSSNSWYGGKIVASSPTSASYSDSVTLNVPTGSGYSVYVFYRALPRTRGSSTARRRAPSR